MARPAVDGLWAVKVECRTGTRRMVGDSTWEDEYHTITWCLCDTIEEAGRMVSALQKGDPRSRETRRAWIDRR